MNALIFSVSIGNGHDQVADNLKNAIMAIDSNNKVKIINILKFISPILDKVILESYLNILRFYPKAWGKIYEKTNTSDPAIDINDVTNRLLTGKLRNTIYNFFPDVILCTHSFPASIIANLKNKNKINYPIITIITDYNIHSSWINEGTDYYVIPHESLAYNMEEYSIPKEKILAFGIPIKEAFSYELNKHEIIEKLNLFNKRTILVMGGGLGLGEINSIVKELDSKFDNIQIIAVAGKNTRLENKLKKYKSKNKLIVFGFVSNMNELLEVSDCVISKPGGVSTAEILAKKKPLIIFAPLPGQESENTEFLLNFGVAVTTPEVKKIPLMIKQIFNFDARLQSIKDLSNLLQKPYSAIDTANFLYKNFNSNKE